MAVQILTELTDILKDYYLPALDNSVTVEASPFYEKIEKLPLPTGGDIIGALDYGINGGFGYSAEGYATPVAHPQLYKSLKLDSKDAYVDIQISNKTIALAKGDRASIFNAYDQEIKSSYAAAKWNMARSLFGDGTGKLGAFTDAISESAEITLNDMSKVIEGLVIDVYNVNGTTITKIAASPVRIEYVDRANSKIYVDTKVTTTHGGFITVQNSYGREITGLGAIYDTTNIATLYGKTRSDDPWLNPLTVDADNDFNTGTLYDAVKEAERYRNTKIDFVMLGDNAFKAWFDHMQLTHTHIATPTLKYKSGAAGFEIVVGSRTAEVVNEPFVPTNEAWCVETSKFKYYTTPWGFADVGTGGAFTLVNGQSYYRALLASYGDVICSNPGGCVRITNCNAAAEDEGDNAAAGDEGNEEGDG